MWRCRWPPPIPNKSGDHAKTKGTTIESAEKAIELSLLSLVEFKNEEEHQVAETGVLTPQQRNGANLFNEHLANISSSVRLHPNKILLLVI